MPGKKKNVIKVQPKVVDLTSKRHWSIQGALAVEAAWDAGYKVGYETAVADIRKRFNV